MKYGNRHVEWRGMPLAKGRSWVQCLLDLQWSSIVGIAMIDCTILLVILDWVDWFKTS